MLKMRQIIQQKWDDAKSSLDLLKKKYIDNFFIGKETPKVIYQEEVVIQVSKIRDKNGRVEFIFTNEGNRIENLKRISKKN